MTDDEIINRAESAARLMSDPLLTGTFSQLEEAYLESLIECKKEDDAGRYRLSEGIKAIRLVQRALRTTIESGQVAAGQLRELKAGRKDPFAIVR